MWAVVVVCVGVLIVETFRRATLKFKDGCKAAWALLSRDEMKAFRRAAGDEAADNKSQCSAHFRYPCSGRAGGRTRTGD